MWCNTLTIITKANYFSNNMVSSDWPADVIWLNMILKNPYCKVRRSSDIPERATFHMMPHMQAYTVRKASLLKFAACRPLDQGSTSWSMMKHLLWKLSSLMKLPQSIFTQSNVSTATCLNNHNLLHGVYQYEMNSKITLFKDGAHIKKQMQK